MPATSRGSILGRPGSILAVLLLVDLFLLVMFLTAVRSGSWMLMQWFDLDSEQSLTTWFASSQLLIAGLILLLASGQSVGANRPSRSFCILVGLGLIFLSADEAASIHETLTLLVKERAAFMPLFRGDHGAWIFVYGVIGLILLAANLRNIAILYHHHRRALLTVAAGFVGLVAGSVLVEIAGYYAWLFSAPLQLTIEEGLELAGVSVMVFGFVLFRNTLVQGEEGPAPYARNLRSV